MHTVGCCEKKNPKHLYLFILQTFIQLLHIFPEQIHVANYLVTL